MIIQRYKSVECIKKTWLCLVVQEGGRIMVTQTGDQALELAISNLSPPDTSNYTCTTTNTAGTYQGNGTIVVHCKSL